MTRLSDDDLHDILNMGVAEAHVEVLAVLDTVEELDRVEIEALSGVDPAVRQLKLLTKRCLVLREGNREARWRLHHRLFRDGAFDREWVLGHIPKGVKMHASDPAISGPILDRIERRRAERRAAKRRRQEEEAR